MREEERSGYHLCILSVSMQGEAHNHIFLHFTLMG